MNVIERVITYSSASTVKPERFYFYPLGDIHLGVIHCDEDLLSKTVNQIHLHGKHGIWLGMGDYGDCITPSDFKRWDGKILAPWMKGNEDNIGPTQVRYVDSMLSPIWDQCLGLIEGNHDENIRKYNHYDFMKELLIKANEKAEVKYAGVSCFIRLIFKREGSTETHEFKIHARHGEGAARTSGARALAVLRLSQSMVDAHITLMGHLHGQESPDIPQRIILKGNKIKAFETIATMTGAWVKAYMQDVPPCYLERWGSPPSTLGCPRIVIEPHIGRMTLEKSRQTQAL